MPHVPDDEIPADVRDMLDEMVEQNRDEIAQVRAALKIDAADTAENRPPITWPITYAHAEAATVAAEGTY